MSEENKNPYQAPESDIMSADMGELNNLAGRGARLVASIIDAIVMLIVVLPVMFAMGLFESMMRPQGPSMMVNIGSALLGIVVFLLINGHLLNKYGQTVGKYVLGIKIVDLQGNKLDFGRLIGLRYLPIWVIQNIPVINFLALLDVLLIFREDRRCAHDLIAGTKVVTVIKD